MSEFARYEAYKDSGVEWLGEIPEHWQLIPNKYLFTEKKEIVGKKSSSYILLSLTLNGIIARDMVNPQGKFPAEFDTYKKVKQGNVIFCLFDIEETPRTVGLAKQDGMITGAYTVIECNERIYSNYFTYYYLSLDFDKKLKSLYTGLRKVIQRGTFLSIKSPLPPINEQERIVIFLDQKTTEIDEAIAKKQRLIELLKEQKAILINQAVTKGLNPNVPMCNSGVEWIGEIPAHWEIIPNKFIFKEINERSKNGLEMHLSMSQKRGVVPATEVAKSLESESYEGAKLVFKNDLVLNRLKAHLAVFSPSSYDGLVSPDYSVFRLRNPEYQVSFFSNLFRTPIYLAELNRRVKGIVVGFLRLYSDDFNAIPSIVPPKQEQQEIVLEINRISDEVKLLTDLTEREIEKLNEFKQTLIAHAVTGKIKV